MGLLDDFKRKVEGVRVVRYTTQAQELKLIPLGDVHLGAPTCDVDKFLGTVDYIKRSRSRVILMGDLMEAASKHSVGAGWVEQVQSPQRQLDALYNVLKPISSQILVLLDGNHEFRIRKQSGLAVSKILAKMLGVKYGGYSCFVYLRVKKFNYVIYAQHGSSNAWYPHTKLTAAMRTARHTDADVYLYGHTHELLPLSVPRQTLNKRSKSIKARKQYFVLTGGFLEYHGSYAERKNMYPVKTGVAKIKFYGNRWDIHCSV